MCAPLEAIVADLAELAGLHSGTVIMGGETSLADIKSRQVHFDAAGGFVETPVYDRARLGAGHRFDGPAIVEEMDSTTLVLPGYGVEVDRYGNLLISPAD